MNHKAVTVESWEEILKFMDRAATKNNDKSKIASILNEKTAYKQRSTKITEARRILLSLLFEMEDYVRTGKFEVADIITRTCKTCGN